MRRLHAPPFPPPPPALGGRALSKPGEFLPPPPSIRHTTSVCRSGSFAYKNDASAETYEHSKTSPSPLLPRPATIPLPRYPHLDGSMCIFQGFCLFFHQTVCLRGAPMGTHMGLPPLFMSVSGSRVGLYP